MQILKRLNWWQQALLVLLILYGAAALWYAYVPPGNIKAQDTINGVPFAQVVGDYYVGDGLGMNDYLQITAEAKFSFRSISDGGGRSATHGNLSVEGTHLALHSRMPDIYPFDMRYRELLPVAWGERLYLIPESRMHDFCQSIAEGDEPRKHIHGHFYLRRKDYERPTAGEPHLPPQWTQVLHEQKQKGKADKRRNAANTGLE